MSLPKTSSRLTHQSFPILPPHPSSWKVFGSRAGSQLTNSPQQTQFDFQQTAGKHSADHYLHPVIWSRSSKSVVPLTMQRSGGRPKHPPSVTPHPASHLALAPRCLRSVGSTATEGDHRQPSSSRRNMQQSPAPGRCNSRLLLRRAAARGRSSVALSHSIAGDLPSRSLFCTVCSNGCSHIHGALLPTNQTENPKPKNQKCKDQPLSPRSQRSHTYVATATTT
jgi:hypothetical protein